MRGFMQSHVVLLRRPVEAGWVSRLRYGVGCLISTWAGNTIVGQRLINYSAHKENVLLTCYCIVARRDPNCSLLAEPGNSTARFTSSSRSNEAVRRFAAYGNQTAVVRRGNRNDRELTVVGNRQGSGNHGVGGLRRGQGISPHARATAK